MGRRLADVTIRSQMSGSLPAMTSHESQWDEAAVEALRAEFGDSYRDRTCLVTGADGFMGSPLSIPTP